MAMTPARLAAFERCPRLLWLMRFRPDVASVEENAEADARRAAAQAVKVEAQRQCPGATAIDHGRGWPAAVAATRAALAARRPVLNAAFERDGLCATIAIAMPASDDRWHLIDVRSATKAKPEHLGTVATQCWAAEGNGLTIASAAVRHLDREFDLPPGGDLSGVFAEADVTDRIAGITAERSATLSGAREVLAGDEPQTLPGDQCRAPHPCGFHAHCGAGLPPGLEWPVSILPRGAGKRFAARGVDDLTRVPVDELRSDTDRRIQRATMTGAVEHDPAGAAAATRDWAYPRIWLDFETVSRALPVWPGSRPYEQVPFQFVADIEEADGRIARREFLSLDGLDPRRACAEALAALPATGAVIAWHASFERGVIERLALCFPDLAAPLTSLADRIVDLLPVARDHWYHRDQRGSWSIKAVLPTIAPHLDYAGLAVKQGGDAVEAYLEASAPDCSPDRRMALDQALRLYCGRDVEAMRVIHRRLIEPAIPTGGAAVWAKPGSAC